MSTSGPSIVGPGRAARGVVAFFVSAAAAGCSLAPRYVRPSVPVPPAYREHSPDGIPWRPARPRDDESRGPWWRLFGDARLDELEESLESSNQGVAQAAAAFLAARAAVQQARSQLFPTVTAAPSVTRSRLRATPFGFSAGNSFTEYALPFDASWQPDFWGKVRGAVAAETFAAQASAADLANVRLTAHAELAVDYYQLRAQDALIVVLSSAAAAYAEALELERVLRKAGLASDQTVAQAQAQLEAARAQAENAGILRAQYEHAIAVLLGRPASEFTVASEPFVAPEPAFPVGVPSELLERRPDVASAERAVAQANAQIGVARAAYFPNVTLSASGGFESFSLAQWLSLPNAFWSLGAAASGLLLDGGLRGAQVRQSGALYDQAVAGYRQTVLSAFQQVEDSLAAVRLSSSSARSQEAAVACAAGYLAEAEARYKAGLLSYLDVVAARASLLTFQQAALAFQVQRVVAAVRLIEALGGGWDDSALPKPAELRR